MVLRFKIFAATLCLVLFNVSLVFAQMFDAGLGIEEETSGSVPASVTRPAARTSTGKAAPAKATEDKAVPTEEADVQKEIDELLKDMQTEQPTKDGSERGDVQFIPVVGNGDEARKQEGGMIFVFYKDFSIRGDGGGRVRCDVTFAVLTTLDQKVSNLSFKLKWPTMLTALSYDDIDPNTETVYEYTLLGDGCYSMDQVPNIIVNRCRVRGMTQQDCASRIRWIRKARTN